jgi:mannose-6-phosphate isomerase-like protein (cupin superfamily)
MNAPDKINLADKFAQFSEHWSPKIVAALNGQHVKLVKFQGAFVWHQHEHEDELFFVVPRGVEHRPVAAQEVSVLLFEPAATVNTGNNPGEKTVAAPEWI